MEGVRVPVGGTVLVGGEWTKEEQALLASLLPDTTIHYLATAPTPAEIAACDIAMVMSWKEVAPHISLMPRLALIQSFLAGVERIPHTAIPSNVVLATGAGSNAAAVAEHAIALYLSLAKNVCFHDSMMREGVFSQMDAQSSDVEGKRALVLGYGHIGRRIGVMCTAMGMKVTAMNRSGKSDAYKTITADELLDELVHADAVFVALPHTKKTEGLLAEDAMSAMKDTAFLVNIARGPIIDQESLYRKLVSTPSFRAGLDVWWSYLKKGTQWHQKYPFEKLPNVIMTPHVAGLGETWRRDMLQTGAKNVLRYMQGKKIENRVDADAYLM